MPLAFVSCCSELSTGCARTASPAAAESDGQSPRQNGAANGSAKRIKASASAGSLQLADLEAQDAVAKRSASALPFKPLCLTFKDVMYSVPFPKVGG